MATVSIDEHMRYGNEKPKGFNTYTFNLEATYQAVGTWSEARREVEAFMRKLESIANWCPFTGNVTFTAELDI
jgi:hypothetical protein